jgi:vitamin B12 transporter
LSATRRHNINYQSDWVLSTHIVSAGVDFEQQNGTVGEVRANRTNVGYYFQDQFLWKQRVSMTGGLRLEDNGSFGFAAVPRFSAALLLRKANKSAFLGMTRPKFNFGLGIKEPNFIQSYSQNPYFRGNPDLKPERTRSIETGIEQELFGEKVRVEVNYFRSLFRDLISFQTTDYSTYEGGYFNLGRSQAWGVEHIVQGFLTPHVKLSGGYTYLKSEVLKSSDPLNPIYGEGARLLLRPTHSGQLGITWVSSRWHLNTAAVFVGNRADSDFVGLGLTEVSGYTRWDLSGSYRINRNVSLYTAFENILNRQYFEALGYPALKFNFRSGLQIKL